MCRATGFDAQQWYHQLFEFSALAEGNMAAEEDADVVPVLVRNIVGPLAVHLAERVRFRKCQLASVGNGF